MEEFKVCEKDLKTKAYSREGLSREEKLDPHELLKEEKRAWIQGVVEAIESAVEIMEADLEKFSNSKPKSKYKEKVLLPFPSLPPPPSSPLISHQHMIHILADREDGGSHCGQQVARLKARADQSPVRQRLPRANPAGRPEGRHRPARGGTYHTLTCPSPPLSPPTCGLVCVCGLFAQAYVCV